MLGENDLRQVVERLIGEQNHLPDNDMKQLIQVIDLLKRWYKKKRCLQQLRTISV